MCEWLDSWVIYKCQVRQTCWICFKTLWGRAKTFSTLFNLHLHTSYITWMTEKLHRHIRSFPSLSWCHSNRAWVCAGISLQYWGNVKERGNHLFLLWLPCGGMTEYQYWNLFVFMFLYGSVLSVFVCMYVCVCLSDEHMLRPPTAYHLPSLSNHLLN